MHASNACDLTRFRHALGRLEDRVAASGWLWDERASLRVDWLLVIVQIKERAA
jgi:hypothetical protein